MEPEFWHQRWRDRQIGFHEGRPNKLLMAHFERFRPLTGGRVFVPLCGKAADLAWLRDQGLAVVGVELDRRAVEEFFAGIGLEATIERDGALERFEAPGITVYAGDIFDLDADRLGPVDFVYDRAALVALPASMRKRYSQHVLTLTDRAPQLLITFEYDQAEMDGPPFSVDAGEIARLYRDAFSWEELERRPISGGLNRNGTAADGLAWHLMPLP